MQERDRELKYKQISIDYLDLSRRASKSMPRKVNLRKVRFFFSSAASSREIPSPISTFFIRKFLTN